MYRRNVTVAAAALFAIGVAFAAQPTSSRTDRAENEARGLAPWTPGKDALMSTRESPQATFARPR